ncbi:hypothetical protein O8I40_06900, partial [Campylobacter lari]|uniref:hypothetical protein n=1 Tax=Campylobacter lari TaxID=201 RepID=UPI00372620D4
DDTSLKQFEDNDLAGIYLSNEKYIFSQEFIDEYSYTDKIESNRGILRNINIEELQTTPFDHVWGWYISQNTSQIVFSNQYEKFAAEYPRLWSKIKFSPRIQEIIKLSNNTAKEAFDNSFIAIHIRSGDIVYDERINSCGIEWHKAMPVEIAMELIEKNKKENKNIVLFGDDLSELRALKQYYHVSIIEDFIQELTGIDRIIFEINFMSKAEVIYSGHSSFARVASYIGLGKEPTFYYKYFGRFQTYTIIKKRINDNRCIVHNLQKSYSYYFLFRLGYAIKKDFQELLDWLRLAWKYNHKNELYALGIVFFSILSNRTQEAEKMICNHSIGEHFLNNFYKQCFFQKIFNNKINVSMITRKRYPNLFCFLNKYYPIFGAIYTHSGTLRVKNHLSYKLGMTFLNNSKTFIDYIKLPFLLFEVTRQHKKEKQEFKTQAKDHNLSPALPPLEECLDYKEVLKIQNGLPYKIGISLIKANKEWYKGGYIKFWYNLYQLKKEFKDKKG